MKGCRGVYAQSILQIPVDQEEEVWSAASNWVLGGVGLRSAVRVRTPAY